MVERGAALAAVGFVCLPAFVIYVAHMPHELSCILFYLNRFSAQGPCHAVCNVFLVCPSTKHYYSVVYSVTHSASGFGHVRCVTLVMLKIQGRR